MTMLRRVFAAVGMAFLTAACAPIGEIESSPVVTVFGPYRLTEAVNFAAALSGFESETGIDVHYVGTGSIAADLTRRLERGDLPDVAIIPQPAVVSDLVERGLIVPLGTEAEAAVRANYSSSLVDVMTFDEDLYAVMYRASVKSLVWYSPSEFGSRDYQVPATWAEMIALTMRMEADGFEPWCFSVESFGATGWVGTDWIEDLMVRTAGPAAYVEWAAGDIHFDDARVRRSFQLFGEIVRTPGRVLGGVERALGVGWREAGRPMFSEPPACLLHRQASFYLSSVPETAEFGTDFDVFVLPPLDESSPAPLLVAGDLAVAFRDRPEVQQLLEYLAGPESGVAWAEAGGYLSPHATFDSSNYANPFDRRVGDFMDNAEIVVFDASDGMSPSVGTGSFWRGIVYYLQTGDLDGTVSMIDTG
jgi:alpha-glucoside transport system substrate-binding protein